MSLVQLNGTQCVLILQWIYLQRKIVLISVCNVAADIDDCLRADCKVLFSWVQHFTCFIVATICGYSNSSLRVSRKANFCDFRGVLFRESTRYESIPVAGRMRCCCRARDGRHLVAGLGDVEPTLLGTSVLPEKIWQWGKKGNSFYSNFIRDRLISRKLTHGKFLF